MKRLLSRGNSAKREMPPADDLEPYRQEVDPYHAHYPPVAQAEAGPSSSGSRAAATAPGQPEQRREAHLSQLAVLENFATHGMYVHFTDEEAQALEEKALAHAMAASKADAKAARKGKHGAGHEQPAMIDLPVDPLSHDEAHRLVQHLGADRSMKKTGSFKRMFSRKGSAKSLASQASSRSLQHQASGRSLQSQDSSRSQAAPRDPNFHAQASGGFENGSHADFVLHNGQHNGYANGHALPDSAPYSHQPYVQQQPLAEQPTYYDPQTQSYVTNPFLDPIHGSDTNPFLDPNHGHHVAYGADGYHDPEMAHALAYSAQQAQQAQRGQADAHDDVDEDLLAVAMAESRQQAEYDDILRDAKQLRLDLGYALLGCQEHQAEWVGKRAQLEATLPRGVEVPHELARDVAHAEYEGEQAELRVVALQDAIEELQSMEDFIRSTKPRRAEAVALTEEIVRQLLERLNFMGFGFAMPGGAAGAPMDSMTVEIVDKFRQKTGIQEQSVPHETAVATPPTPSPRAHAKPKIPTIPATAAAAAAGAGAMAAAAQALHEDGPTTFPPVSSAGGHPQLVSPGSRVPKLDLAGTHEPRSSLDRDRDQGQSMVLPPIPPATPGRLESIPNRALATPLSSPQRSTVSDSARATPQAPVPTPLTSQTLESLGLNSLNSQPRAADAASRWETSSVASDTLSTTSSFNPERSRIMLSKASSKIAHLLADIDKKHAARKATDANIVRRMPLVVHVYGELKRIMPQHLMDANFAVEGGMEALPTSSKREALRKEARLAREAEKANRPADVEAVQAEAAKHARAIARAIDAIGRLKVRQMVDLVAFVEQTDSTLDALRANEDAVLAQFDWPKQRYDAMREAATLWKDLSQMIDRQQRWQLTRNGSCQEEGRCMETYFDTLRALVTKLTDRQDVLERRFAMHGLPWEKGMLRNVRYASLNLATLFMSRVLFEVANLERSQSSQHEKCLEHLAEAVRMGYKIHQFAGGFNADCNELFEKVKRLTQYYVRTIDPAWLRDTNIVPNQ